MKFSTLNETPVAMVVGTHVSLSQKNREESMVRCCARVGVHEPAHVRIAHQRPEEDIENRCAE
jgi:hypothetical protein